MLHWQRKSARNRLSLWVKLALLSTAVHAIALFMLLFVYRGASGDLAFTLSANQLNNLVDVVFVKEIPANYLGKTGRACSKNKQKSSVRPASPEVARGELAKGTNDKKSSNPRTELKELKDEKKRSNPSQVQGERDKKKKRLEEQRKKREMERKKKLEEKKKVEKKSSSLNSAKRMDEEKKNIEEKKSLKEDAKQDQLNEIQPTVRPEELRDRAVTRERVDEVPNSDLEFDENTNFQVYGSYRELEAMQQFQELQQEISRCWRPPVGISPEIYCQIAVTYDWDGKLTNMEMVKPSGVLMFDVSSRNAVTAMEAPKFVRGKTFTITFKP